MSWVSGSKIGLGRVSWALYGSKFRFNRKFYLINPNEGSGKGQGNKFGLVRFILPQRSSYQNKSLFLVTVYRWRYACETVYRWRHLLLETVHRGRHVTYTSYFWSFPCYTLWKDIKIFLFIRQNSIQNINWYCKIFPIVFA